MSGAQQLFWEYLPIKMPKKRRPGSIACRLRITVELTRKNKNVLSPLLISNSIKSKLSPLSSSPILTPPIRDAPFIPNYAFEVSLPSKSTFTRYNSKHIKSKKKSDLPLLWYSKAEQCISENKLYEAIDLLRITITIWEAAYGKFHIKTAIINYYLANVLLIKTKQLEKERDDLVISVKKQKREKLVKRSTLATNVLYILEIQDKFMNYRNESEKYFRHTLSILDFIKQNSITDNLIKDDIKYYYRRVKFGLETIQNTFSWTCIRNLIVRSSSAPGLDKSDLGNINTRRCISANNHFKKRSYPYIKKSHKKLYILRDKLRFRL